jgi:hypothetical protein
VGGDLGLAGRDRAVGAGSGTDIDSVVVIIGEGSLP